MKNPKSPKLRMLISIMKKAYNNYHPHFHDTSRRRFITDASKAAVVGGVLSLFPLASCNTKDGNKARIAIVGGGMAGLRCAWELKKKNIVATVYEADKRTGGRMYSVQNAMAENTWTEFGGEFLDTNHDDMFSLVEEFGLKTFNTYDDTAHRDVFYFEGKMRSEEEVIATFEKIIPTLENDRMACGEDFDTEFALNLDNTPLETYLRQLPCPEWFQDMLSGAYKAEFGLDCSEQSSLNFLDMIGLDTSEGFLIFGDSDEAHKIIGGNQQLPDLMAEKLGEQVVREMKLKSLIKTDGEYQLAFENGSTVFADFVVLAIPFTALRKINLELPEMSEEKRRCIQELGYGQNNKVMLRMKERPWRAGSTSYAGFLFHKVVQNGWDNTQMQNDNSGPAGYTVFLGGSESIAVAEAAKEAGLRDQVPGSIPEAYTIDLDKVFPGFKNAYTGEHKAALWSNHPHIHGSYGCLKVGQWQNVFEHIASPVGNVLFAGEHCSEAFFGYMNGAAETGRKAAEAIEQAMG
jgi:monoamine oxidase